MLDVALPKPVVPTSPLRAFWLAFKENRGAVIGLVIVSLIVFVAIFADVIAPYPPKAARRDSCSAPTVWAATCSHACCMARASRCSSACR
jgi:dipeptide transport system permease protein